MIKQLNHGPTVPLGMGRQLLGKVREFQTFETLGVSGSLRCFQFLAAYELTNQRIHHYQVFVVSSWYWCVET
jgi:hypothetical protein